MSLNLHILYKLNMWVKHSSIEFMVLLSFPIEEHLAPKHTAYQLDDKWASRMYFSIMQYIHEILK